MIAAGEQVYPLQLGELLPEANRLADASGEDMRNTVVPQSIR
ncbi:hypothetical protein BZL30_0069 [Mycobacterium kansasii]|uniref:Uncharacterized protein n=1 Tax=Mycobacterium kansasii TaxID=1768 RepID=A0A1V3XUC2_MYCKA|nr:hypothetical protein BZL30_0069 [Mycobacterium kansasii]